MIRTEEERLKASLIEALESWWDNGAQAANVGLPYVGDDVFAQMANAGMAVLLAVLDTQECALRDGIWKEGTTES